MVMEVKPGPTDIDELFYGTVTVGERGQIVVPAQARVDFDINPGDKLLVFSDPHRIGLNIVNVLNVGPIMTLMEQTLARMRQELGDVPDESE